MLQTKFPSPTIGSERKRGAMTLGVVVLCLAIAGCALSVGVTNSPDWCNNNPGNVTCR
jgi:hypothetical protein